MENENLQQKIIKLLQEVRDLKTAKTIPSTVRFFRTQIKGPSGDSSNLIYEIQFKQEDFNGMMPITVVSSSGNPITNEFDPTTMTQRFEIHSISTSIEFTITINSNREIVGVTRIQ